MRIDLNYSRNAFPAKWPRNIERKRYNFDHTLEPSRGDLRHCADGLWLSLCYVYCGLNRPADWAFSGHSHIANQR